MPLLFSRPPAPPVFPAPNGLYLSPALQQKASSTVPADLCASLMQLPDMSRCSMSGQLIIPQYAAAVQPAESLETFACLGQV